MFFIYFLIIVKFREAWEILFKQNFVVLYLKYSKYKLQVATVQITLLYFEQQKNLQ